MPGKQMVVAFNRKKLRDILLFIGGDKRNVATRSRYAPILKDVNIDDLLNDLDAFADMTHSLIVEDSGNGKQKVKGFIIKVEKVAEW